MVTVTMEQIVDFKNGADFLDGVKLPLKAAYKINKLKKGIDTEFEYYGDKFREIVDTYAKKDENGKIIFSDDGEQILIEDGKVDECNQALVDLQTLEIEIDNANLTLEDLGDSVECTPEELEIILPFFA